MGGDRFRQVEEDGTAMGRQIESEGQGELARYERLCQSIILTRTDFLDGVEDLKLAPAAKFGEFMLDSALVWQLNPVMPAKAPPAITLPSQRVIPCKGNICHSGPLLAHFDLLLFDS